MKKVSFHRSATYVGVGNTSDIIAPSPLDLFIICSHPPAFTNRQTSFTYHGPCRSRTASPCIRIPHHQKPPGQFRQSPFHRNPVRTFGTFSPVRCVTSVVRRIWQGAAVSSSAHQNIRKQNKGEGNIYLRHGTPRQASAQRRYCAASFVLALCFVSLGRSVPNTYDKKLFS